MEKMEDVEIEVMQALKKGVKVFKEHFEGYNVSLRLTIKVERMFINEDGVMTEITYKECN